MEGNNAFRRMLGIVLLVLCCGSLFAQQKKLTIDLKNGSFIIVDRTAAVSTDIEGLAVFFYFRHDFLGT